MIGSAKSQNINTLLEHPQSHLKQFEIACPPRLIRLGKDLGLVIESVEIIGSIVNIRADLMRRKLLIRLTDRRSESGQIQHKTFFDGCCRCKKLRLLPVDPILSGLLEDGLYPDDRIQNIRSGV